MDPAPPAFDSTEMALDRTWLAHERTLMAWVRTATSMISFGFTIYKFFEYQMERGVSVRRGIISPRTFGMIIISIGLIALLMATFAHHKQTKYLADRLVNPRFSLAELVAGLISCFEILVLISTAVRA